MLWPGASSPEPMWISDVWPGPPVRILAPLVSLSLGPAEVEAPFIASKSPAEEVGTVTPAGL